MVAFANRRGYVPLLISFAFFIGVTLTPGVSFADNYTFDVYGGGTYGAGITGTGACLNCDSPTTSTTTTTTTTTTKPSGGGGGGGGGGSSVTATAGSSTASTTAPSATGTATLCAVDSVSAGSDPSLAQLINLFISLNIIPAEKAGAACQALANASQTSPVATTNGTFRFSKSLKQGMRDSDVKELQKFLNAHNFTVAVSGAGSVGFETDFFGPATVAAVKKFQAAYADEVLKPVSLTQPTGFFGPSSIKKANALLEK